MFVDRPPNLVFKEVSDGVVIINVIIIITTGKLEISYRIVNGHVSLITLFKLKVETYRRDSNTKTLNGVFYMTTYCTYFVTSSNVHISHTVTMCMHDSANIMPI